MLYMFCIEKLDFLEIRNMKHKNGNLGCVKLRVIPEGVFEEKNINCKWYFGCHF